MGRPSNWNSPTTSVRLPIHALPAVLALAKQLDDPKPVETVESNVQNPAEATHTREGLPICKPKADAETISQGLAEGWIVPSAPLPPYLLSSASSKGTYHYTVNPPPDIPADVWAEADRLVEEVCGSMSQKEHWLVLGRLVEEWGQKVDG